MKFEIRLIKAPTEDSPRTETLVEGIERPIDHITMHDMQKVIEVEQWLEHVLGIRVHINESH